MKNRGICIILFSVLLACYVSAAGCGERPAQQAEKTYESAKTFTADSIPTTAPEATSASAPNDDNFYVMDIEPASVVSDNAQLLETEYSFYYLCKGKKAYDNAMIYFTDKEYMDWMPLCGKPDCMHNSEDCNAMLEKNCSGIWLYGHSIYYALSNGKSTPQLWRMDLDGSNHEMLGSLDYRTGDDKALTEGSWTTCFHNKYVFVTYRGFPQSDDDSFYDDSGNAVRCTYYASLDEPEKGEKLEFTLDGSETLSTMYIWCPYGDYIYGHPFRESKRLIKYDISARTATTVCTLPFDPAFQSYHIYDGRLYISSAYFDGLIIAVDLDTGEIETVRQVEPGSECWQMPYGDYIWGVGVSSSVFPNGTFVYDHNCELVQEIPYESYGEKQLLISYIVGDYVFGYEYFDGTEISFTPPSWYLRVSDVGTDYFMWRRWAPEE